MVNSVKTDNSRKAVLLTPPGSAAIAVVRLAGAGIHRVFDGRFSGSIVPGRAVHGTLRDGDNVIDDPVVVFHEGGTIADVNLHGGPWVVASFMQLVRREGFEIVESVASVLPALAVD